MNNLFIMLREELLHTDIVKNNNYRKARLIFTKSWVSVQKTCILFIILFQFGFLVTFEYGKHWRRSKSLQGGPSIIGRFKTLQVINESHDKKIQNYKSLCSGAHDYSLIIYLESINTWIITYAGQRWFANNTKSVTNVKVLDTIA